MTKEELFEKKIGIETLEKYVDNKVHLNTVRGLFLRILGDYERELINQVEPTDTTMVGKIRELQVLNDKMKELLKQAKCPNNCESGAIIYKDQDGNITDVGPCQFCYQRAQILEL